MKKGLSAFVSGGLFCLLLTSCVYGPKRENDTPVDYLNGNNYQTPGTPTPFSVPPALERQIPAWEISGRVVIDSLPLPEPLKYQTVALLREGRVLQRIRCGPEGEFSFSALSSNGDYLVRLESERYMGETPVRVSAYKTRDLELRATARP